MILLLLVAAVAGLFLLWNYYGQPTPGQSNRNDGGGSRRPADISADVPPPIFRNSSIKSSPTTNAADPDDEPITIAVKWLTDPVSGRIPVPLQDLDDPERDPVSGSLDGTTFTFHPGSGTRFAIQTPSAAVIMLARGLILEDDRKTAHAVTLFGAPSPHIEVLAGAWTTLAAESPAAALQGREVNVTMMALSSGRPLAVIPMRLTVGQSIECITPAVGVHFQVKNDEYYLASTTPDDLTTMHDGQVVTLHLRSLVMLTVEVHESEPGAWKDLLRLMAKAMEGPKGWEPYALLDANVHVRDGGGHGGTVRQHSIKRTPDEVVSVGTLADRFEVPIAVPDTGPLEFTVTVRAVATSLGIIASGAGRLARFDGNAVIRVDVIKDQPDIRVVVVDTMGEPFADIPVSADLSYPLDSHTFMASGASIEASTDAQGVAVIRGVRGAPEAILTLRVEAELKEVGRPERISLEEAAKQEEFRFVLVRAGGPVKIEMSPELPAMVPRMPGPAGNLRELYLFPHAERSEPLVRDTGSSLQFPLVYSDIPAGVYDLILSIYGIPYHASSIVVDEHTGATVVLRPKPAGATTLRITGEDSSVLTGARLLPMRMPESLAWAVLREAKQVGGSRFPIITLAQTGEVQLPWSASAADLEHWWIEFDDGKRLARLINVRKSAEPGVIEAGLDTIPTGTVQVDIQDSSDSAELTREIGITAVSREDEHSWTANMHWGTTFPVVDGRAVLTVVPEGTYTVFVIERKDGNVSLRSDEAHRAHITVRRNEITKVNLPR
ncbi:MAG: hypothetical protein K8I27_03925 [Planctomycetes bacterium]|nr:hypothetical protein [Planctomycetota bacterium]